MTEKEMDISINDKLGIVTALIKTANIAIANRECFGDDGQSVAITLDIANTKLEQCREQLDLIGKM